MSKTDESPHDAQSGIVAKSPTEPNARVKEWVESIRGSEMGEFPPRDIDRDSMVSAGKVSQASSSASSKASLKLKEAKVKRACAALKLKQLKAEQELKLKGLELEMQGQMIKLQSEAEMADIECQVWSDGADSESGAVCHTAGKVQTQVGGHSLTPPMPQLSVQGSPADQKVSNSKTEPTPLNPEAISWPCYQQAMIMQAEACQKLAAAFSDSVDRPKPEYIYFSGDPTSYWKFINNIDVNLESVGNPRKKLNYLIQYCRGPAREAIEDCVMMDPQTGYDKARQILHSMYGRPHVISRAHISSVINGPPVKSSDEAGLTKLSLQMQRCMLTLTQMGYESDLNNSENLLKITRRFPLHIRAKWVERADRIIESGLEPNFRHLTDFVEERARVSQNMYAKDLETKSTKPEYTHRRRDERRYEARTFTTRVGEPLRREANNHSGPGCLMCQGEHDIWRCPEFLRSSISQRRTVVRDKEACFNCLGRGHTTKGCLSKFTCKTCSKKHHTLLHDPSYTPTTSRPEASTKDTTNAPKVSSHCHTTGAGAGKTFMQVLPVRVLGPHGSVETYALLDKCADITLCSKGLVEKLNVKGTQCQYSIKTVNGSSLNQNGEKVNLELESMDGSQRVSLDVVYTIEGIPGSTVNIPTQADLSRWSHLSDVKLYELEDKTIDLLLGAENTDVFWTEEERRGKRREPYAMLTTLGWTVVGGSDARDASQSFHANYINSADDLLHRQVELMWTTEFADTADSVVKSMSVEDKQALNVMESTVSKVNGHYQLSLPWRTIPPALKPNRNLAERRLHLLRKRLIHDSKLKEMYIETMDSYITKGHASVLDKEQSAEEAQRFYIPHHPVMNANKPNKVRVVFDCASRCDGTSLNEQLLSGPDLTNSLTGVLTRFREAPIALMADIESMFHQVFVTPEDRKFLRFLWWPDHDLSKEPQDHCMNVHLFGAKSSPSCVNFCLQRTAQEHGHKYDQLVVDSVLKNFYVDDFLKSVWSREDSLNIVSYLPRLLDDGGFKLCKWMSNDIVTLEQIAPENRATTIVDLSLEDIATERALGIKWDVESDSLFFETLSKTKPLTRRGILSMVSSLFDPLGLVAPLTLSAKIILQDLCKSNYGWDAIVGADYVLRWREWLSDLKQIPSIHFPRCLFPKEFGKPTEIQLHHFSDASTCGYGAVSYIRAKNAGGEITCALLMGKSRVAPVKTVTIPRLELAAAVVAAKLDALLRHDLNLEIDKSFFWTDSTAVLQFIGSESRRFLTFVANRVMAIHERSEPSQWHHVGSADNPADHASRGIQMKDEKKLKQWISGPEFLWQEEMFWPQTTVMPNLPIDHVELKKTAVVHATSATEPTFIESLVERCSSWKKLQRLVAWMYRFKLFCMKKCKHFQLLEVPIGDLQVEELHVSSTAILQHVQKKTFPSYFSEARTDCDANVTQCKSLRKLSPVLRDGLLCVGGRLDSADISSNAKHPVIIPKGGHLTELIVQHFHHKSAHTGVNQTLSTIRQYFWVIHGKTTVRSILGKCMMCKRLNARKGEQIMAPLPEDRLTYDEPPFSRVGVDYFGPFQVKQGRSLAKRYGCIFTCLSSRAVHIEVSHALDTDSFICALRRFTSRRGDPKIIRSDNGTNFKGGQRELSDSIAEWNHTKISDYLLQKDVRWVYNPPGASHMGGVWERLIRSVRRVLTAVLHEQTVSDEVLATVMAETERILNDRPLTAVSDDPNDLSPLTPNHLLLLRENHSLPPGVFHKADGYVVRRWRQAQYLANIFWRRWVREYLPMLQERQKWLKVHRNFKEGDLVLVADKNEPRGKWPLGRVEEAHKDKQGMVRSAKVRTANTCLTRPVTQLCLLEAASDAEKGEPQEQGAEAVLNPQKMKPGEEAYQCSEQLASQGRPVRKNKGKNPKYAKIYHLS